MILVAVLVPGAIVGVVVQIAGNGEQNAIQTPARAPAGTLYSAHGLISIDGNGGFTNASGVLWGDGTASDPYIIADWEIAPSYSDGIRVQDTDAHFIIRSCYVHDALGGSGIYLFNCTNGTLENNNCSTNEGAGIVLESSSNNKVINNTCVSNSYHGILVYSARNNTLMGNNCSLNGHRGIGIEDSNDATLINNTCSSNLVGIALFSSFGITLSNNVMIGDGIDMQGDILSHYNTHAIDTSNMVNGASVHYYKNQTGAIVPAGAGQVILANCTDFVVENQNLSEATVGIEIAFSSSITISNNSCISSSQYGIDLDSSSNNTLVDNDCSSSLYGIRIEGGSRNMLIRNDCLACRQGIAGSSNHSTLIGNNCSDDGSGISLAFSDNSTLAYNNCYGDYPGVSLWASNDSTLINNNCSKGPSGIELSLSTRVRLIDNDCTSNFRNGISLSGVSNSTLFDNNCSSNGYYGISLESSNGNMLINNTCSSNGVDGITLIVYPDGTCEDNEISSNLIYNNALFGVRIASGSNNRIWNNTIIGNNGATSTYSASHVQARDEGTGNWWNSTEGQGNYWGDWTTPDANHDGVVDVPYIISGSTGAKDWYPLTTIQTQIPEFGMMPFVVMSLMAVIVLAGETRRRKKS